MLAAFLGGWEIVLLLVIGGGIGFLLLITLVVVLLANLQRLRGQNNPLPSPSSPTQPSAN